MNPDDAIDVALTVPELRHTAYMGLDWFMRAFNDGRPPAYGVDRDDFAATILGCWGEVVVCKHFNVYWTGDRRRPDRGTGDIGRTHIRTGSQPHYNLIVHDRDTDLEPFVLVVKTALPVFRIIGWIMGEDAKQERYWRSLNGRPAYVVPQADLYSIATLPDAYLRS